jgi:hypothetical protein
VVEKNKQLSAEQKKLQQQLESYAKQNIDHEEKMRIVLRRLEVVEKQKSGKGGRKVLRPHGGLNLGKPACCSASPSRSWLAHLSANNLLPWAYPSVDCRPCGVLNKKCACMVDGECRFQYPRQFCEATQQGNDSYPTYRRRDDGCRVKIRRAELNNWWVVPYNPGLLMKYNCHINVEACSSIKAVKYLFKYIYKGHDKHHSR